MVHSIVIFEKDSYIGGYAPRETLSTLKVKCFFEKEACPPNFENLEVNGAF